MKQSHSLLELYLTESSSKRLENSWQNCHWAEEVSTKRCLRAAVLWVPSKQGPKLGWKMWRTNIFSVKLIGLSDSDPADHWLLSPFLTVTVVVPGAFTLPSITHHISYCSQSSTEDTAYGLSPSLPRVHHSHYTVNTYAVNRRE